MFWDLTAYTSTSSTTVTVKYAIYKGSSIPNYIPPYLINTLTLTLTYNSRPTTPVALSTPVCLIGSPYSISFTSLDSDSGDYVANYNVIYMYSSDTTDQ